MRTALAIATLVLALSVRPALAATGSLDAVGPDGRALGGCPLEHTDVKATVSGFVARVTVTQRFGNPFSDPIEAIYTFPLSERAAVDAMTMRTGDREIRGDIKTREEAHRIYEEAKRAGKLTSILDEERPNIFTQSLANVMPGAKVEIVISYVEPLKFAAGTFELTFPTVVGPRFIPPAGVPDADRITPPVTPEGTRAGHDIAIAVDVDAGLPIGTVESPLHEIDVARPDATHVRVALRAKDEIPNRDFVLRWGVSGDQVRSGYLAHRDPKGDGYVTFILVPPKRVTATTAAPKEMIFVIDRSGSQSGLPLLKAKETMHWILDHMNANDTFQVVDFGNTASQLFPTPQPASLEMRRRARTYIDALEANGGTMMADAVETVCRMPAADNRLRIVTFMTDGYVGNDLEVLGLVKKLRGTSRWFPFGTGNGVNRFLIDGMARLGGGEADYVLLNESGEKVARQFYDKIASPVLTDVHVDFEGLEVVDVFPREQSDVWAERPLVVHARYRTAGHGRVVLRGFQQGRAYEQALDVTLPAAEPEHDAIASMWARAKVEALTNEDLSAMQSGSFPAPLKDQIVQVALAHRIVTPFTSFVAVEDRVVNEGGVTRTVAVPVEMPQGVTYEGVFGDGRGGAGGKLAAAQAPAGSPMRALGYAAKSATEPMARDELRADKAAPLEEKEYDRPARTLSVAARRRLAPALATLIEKGPGAPGAATSGGGWVRVRVSLKSPSADVVRALEAAGLQLGRIGTRTIEGVVALDKLVALAELDAVERIEPATT
ncbi:MAG TPA: VIT and VWA domain-containing protein [Candidatus Eisenbacteria bacterium]|nr:VIT and VWA domain-containing protein [Candidatus Eisenbacteria bacterium]